MYDTFNAGESSVQFARAGQTAQVDFGAFDPTQYVPSNSEADINATPLINAIQHPGLHTGTQSGEVAIDSLWV